MLEWTHGRPWKIPIQVREKHVVLFQVLQSNKKFEWTPECEKAFQMLKNHLKTLPPLTKPVAGNSCSLYLRISHVAVSSV